MCIWGALRVNALNEKMDETQNNEKETKTTTKTSHLLARRKSNYVYPDTYIDKSPIPTRLFAPTIKHYIDTFLEEI